MALRLAGDVLARAPVLVQAGAFVRLHSKPRAHSGLPLPFTGEFDTAEEAEAAGVDQAKHWIDRQPV